jgi:NAD(P)-dependent dehydrogenase (short-subunit alcohol dehydrogenase family)
MLMVVSIIVPAKGKTMSRTVLITGAASGIGWATAQLFAERGDSIIVADLQGAHDAAAQLGPKHTGFELDVTDEGQVIKLFSKISELDVLVNNAGIGDSHHETLDQEIGHFRKVLDVHLSGSFLMAREAGRMMSAGEGGAIVNLSSIAGVVGLPKRNAYGAAKAGISMMTRNLACEWASKNIRVNAVAPGYVGTDLVKKLIDDGKVQIEAIKKRTPLGRLIDPTEIAEVIWFLASQSASAITGVTLSVDAGWAAFGDFGDTNSIVS